MPSDSELEQAFPSRIPVAQVDSERSGEYIQPLIVQPHCNARLIWRTPSSTNSWLR